ncbi:MAG: nuclear transport factor 2 family protein [Steroidobacteraceae bacterium]
MRNAPWAGIAAFILAAPAAFALELPPDLAKAVKAYDQAQINGDRSELQRLLADDYTLLSSSGQIENKELRIRLSCNHIGCIP